MRAAKEFNLTLSTFDSEADNQMGIWDGRQIVLDVRLVVRASQHTGLRLIFRLHIDKGQWVGILV